MKLPLLPLALLGKSDTFHFKIRGVNLINIFKFQKLFFSFSLTIKSMCVGALIVQLANLK